ncbi:MAG TPA: arginase [Candidatus Saccharimonadales bacterium]|nr:arginase [Candidatus Saccharimonadales bacterium]
MKHLLKAQLIGVPLDLGAENLGVSMGTDTFRYQGIVKKLQSAGLRITDKGNIHVAERSKVAIGNPQLRRVSEIVRVSEETAKLTDAAMQAGEKAIVLGGDHSICLGAVSGASVGLNGNLGIIYFDAHGDMNTHETTPTGNIHGMQLASLMGFGASELTSVYGSSTKIKKENLVHIGGCDFDQAEKDLVKHENLQAFSMLDLMKSGISPALQMIEDLAKRVDNIWVSLDLDSIDAVYAPGAGMPNKKGLTYREISALAEHIGRQCNVVGVDVVEYNPLQDEQGKTAELAIELIATFFGKEYSWYTHYLEKNQLSN